MLCQGLVGSFFLFRFLSVQVLFVVLVCNYCRHCTYTWTLELAYTPEESLKLAYLSPPQKAQDTQVACIWFVNNTLSQTKWYLDSLTLEHKTSQKLEGAREGGTAVKFSGQPCLMTAANDLSTASVSALAACISDKVTWRIGRSKLCHFHVLGFHFGWWPHVTDIPRVFLDFFILIGWREISFAKRICIMYLNSFTVSYFQCKRL